MWLTGHFVTRIERCGDYAYAPGYVPPVFDPAVEAALFSGPLCGKFNSTTAVQTNVTYNLPLNYIEFHFESDNSLSYDGFEIEWSFIEKEAFFPEPEPVTVQPVQNLTEFVPQNTLYLPVANETSGVITSPNYPDDYPVNQTYYYSISIPYNESAYYGGKYTGISLIINDFDIEPAPECLYDSLSLTHYNFRKRRDHDSVAFNYTDYQGSDNDYSNGSGNFTDYPDYSQFENLVDPEVETAFFSRPLCGNQLYFQNVAVELPYKLDLNLNFIGFEFKSDHFFNHRGFEIEWSFIEDEG